MWMINFVTFCLHQLCMCNSRFPLCCCSRLCAINVRCVEQITGQTATTYSLVVMSCGCRVAFLICCCFSDHADSLWLGLTMPHFDVVQGWNVRGILNRPVMYSCLVFSVVEILWNVCDYRTKTSVISYRNKITWLRPCVGKFLLLASLHCK